MNWKKLIVGVAAIIGLCIAIGLTNRYATPATILGALVGYAGGRFVEDWATEK